MWSELLEAQLVSQFILGILKSPKSSRSAFGVKRTLSRAICRSSNELMSLLGGL